MAIDPAAPAAPAFSAYQRVVVAILAFLQFAVILDFMLISPLGVVIMPALKIDPTQFGLVVSAYAFSAGAAGLLTAAIADRFDRKRLLLVFYAGFIAGTVWCGSAQSFESLLFARIVTGLFGGVIGSIVLAIAADLFAPRLRGRVMGLIQTAFAASQVLGIPFGLYLSNRWDWHAPFFVLAALGLVGGAIVAWRMKPVVHHLAVHREHGAWAHLTSALTEPRHLQAFVITGLITTGGYMLMPFSSAYVVVNLGIGLERLPMLYLATGLCTIAVGPLVGRAADRFGGLRVFTVGTAVSAVTVLVYTHLPPTPFPLLVAVNAAMFVGIFSRMIPFQAIVAGVPVTTQRGAFNAINASVQQLAGGFASVVAGHVVTIGADNSLRHFDLVGYIVVSTSLVALVLLGRLTRREAARAHTMTAGTAAHP